MSKKSGFKTLVTTKNSFTQDELTLFEAFKSAGTKEAVAEAIAHSFTKFMLGYITERGVGNTLVEAGATEPFAIAIANLFVRIKFGEVAPVSLKAKTGTEQSEQRYH